MAGAAPLALVTLAAYTVVELLKFRLGFQFTLDADPRNARPSFPFVNDAFYVVWLPLAAAVQLIALSPAWLAVAVLHAALFRRTIRIYVADLRTVGAACRRVPWVRLLHARR